MAEDKGIAEGGKNGPRVIDEKKPKGIMSRIWNGIFRFHGDNVEKRLHSISKEEAAVLSRMKRRSLTWRKMTRHLIIFSVIFEDGYWSLSSLYISPQLIQFLFSSFQLPSGNLQLHKILYHIMPSYYHCSLNPGNCSRLCYYDDKINGFELEDEAFRVMPMFLLPGISFLAYSAFVSFMTMCDRKDHETLGRLRAERQAKIDELKEKTNYYTTQQLIQRYDPDPAAKAAAATVLASKLGADSGLKVYMGDEAKLNDSTGMSNDVEFVQAGSLRNRKQVHTRSITAGSSPVLHHDEEMLCPAQSEGLQTSEQNQLVVEHHSPHGSAVHDGGWIARLAALLVGEDPTQSYALICGNCHMHNGLARKEDFPYITYYCPHCHALNQPKHSEGCASGINSPSLGNLKGEDNVEVMNNASNSLVRISDGFENYSTVIGIKCKDGIVMGVEKLIASKMMLPGSNRRIHSVHRHSGMAVAGLAADGRQIVARAKSEATNYESVYGEPIPVNELAGRVASYVHLCTLYWWLRPFGCGVILGGYDRDGPQLYMIEPSGISYRYFGAAIGKGKQAAKTEIEKLKLSEMTCREGVIDSIYKVHDEAKDKAFELEMSWVCDESKRLHQKVPDELLEEAKAAARTALEEMDAD
ncbi:hypothetical protein GH714_035522 [Hevea brasiliensis]|uniref:Proteasome subunit alpha type-3 n=2 Tax=Magnoliopsida TaxID=3398 RepID=A0A6A6KT03_HEVBR|nr:hypothetical protein GH714_035522 [Hevea brasiliensis]